MTTAVTTDQIRNLIDRAERGALTPDEAARLRASVEELIRRSATAEGDRQGAGDVRPMRVRPLWIVAADLPRFSARLSALEP